MTRSRSSAGAPRTARSSFYVSSVLPQSLERLLVDRDRTPTRARLRSSEYEPSRERNDLLCDRDRPALEVKVEPAEAKRGATDGSGIREWLRYGLWSSVERRDPLHRERARPNRVGGHSDRC